MHNQYIVIGREIDKFSSLRTPGLTSSARSSNNAPLDKTFAFAQAKPLLEGLKFDSYSLHSHDSALPAVLAKGIQLFEQAQTSKNLFLILTDGRFNKSCVLPLVHQCLTRGVLPLVVVVDGAPSAAGENTGTKKQQSIYDMKQVGRGFRVGGFI